MVKHCMYMGALGWKWTPRRSGRIIIIFIINGFIVFLVFWRPFLSQTLLITNNIINIINITITMIFAYITSNVINIVIITVNIIINDNVLSSLWLLSMTVVIYHYHHCKFSRSRSLSFLWWFSSLLMLVFSLLIFIFMMIVVIIHVSGQRSMWLWFLVTVCDSRWLRKIFVCLGTS